ncbi:pyridoxal-phosphate dependent enzyme [Patulibacter defluvii]|uniref:pyridoxal-phosphate dependent enzyme n=1 Tax=Patulibacter defluvii TaxID=3095358 RepID=UPI002A763FB1|nr:pyridoxal-phosphate dependent enzyme [Patulibacter sp. DM4]
MLDLAALPALDPALADALRDEQLRVLLQDPVRPLAPTGAPAPALAFHRGLPGYAPTPLREAPVLAEALGVGRVLIKDESSRLGLPAFKMLGVAWAGGRAVAERLGVAPERIASLDDLAAVVAAGPPLRLVTATDGNHGRALARFGRTIGLPVHVVVPAAMRPARIAALRDEGASVEQIAGTYDDAVADAARIVRQHPADLLVSDTTTDGDDAVARWVIEGYETIGREIVDALGRAPDLLLVPIGVGGLAAAMARCFADAGSRLIGVEPLEAASTAASVAAGRLLELPGPTDSIMAGLSCGTPSEAAWPTVAAAFAGHLVVGATAARAGMRVLRALGIDGGECAGGVVGALLQAADRQRAALAAGPASTVVLIATEGVTDADGYRELVGAVA